MRNNLSMITDPLSDVLRLVGAQSVMAGGLAAGGAWAIHFPAGGTINFWGVMRGGCWLLHDGAPPRRVEAGDVFLRSATTPLILASDPQAAPVDIYTVVAGKKDGVSRVGDGDDFFMAGGKVKLDADSGKVLLDTLPSLIQIPAAAPQAPMLQWLLGQLMQEQARGLPGAGAASEQLAHLMFIQILRAHLDTAGPLAAGWLRAASDLRLAPALRLMHGEPGRTWQLAELAGAAHMSRASFALHFKSVAGIAPLAYLTAWRMQLAQRALRRGRTPVSTLALTLGYGSESAFSNAFKRVTGVAPKRYRQQTAPDDTA